MTDDFQPFFSSGEADSISDQYPNLKSLDVEVKMSKPVGDRLRYKRYGKSDLPSHVNCPVCGTKAAVGWKVEKHISQNHNQFKDKVSCSGQEREGKSCIVKFEIEGTVEYV
ncbi:hypothetical protein [Halorhabdus rudnickae]|uniref:hypothetical protein n=1 Tax=Halorhabdus rudnickae TaxID=1775544 RepID=UPI0010832336|nr:hypothetical protein [Halorhabdus rudnickae]